MSELKPCPMCINGTYCLVTGDPCSILQKSLCNAFQKAYELGRRTQPANEPLTLEQLREMGGEPAYVAPINQSEWICWETDGNAAYGMVRKSWVRVWREEAADMQHTDFDFDDYGKIWVAYAHKPEVQIGVDLASGHDLTSYGCPPERSENK